MTNFLQDVLNVLERTAIGIFLMDSIFILYFHLTFCMGDENLSYQSKREKYLFWAKNELQISSTTI